IPTPNYTPPQYFDTVSTECPGGTRNERTGICSMAALCAYLSKDQRDQVERYYAEETQGTRVPFSTIPEERRVALVKAHMSDLQPVWLASMVSCRAVS